MELTAQLCACNNCNAIMIDQNPNNQPELDYSHIELSEMELIQEQDDETGNMIENYWGCPNCQTDAYLMDIEGKIDLRDRVEILKNSKEFDIL